MNQFFISNYRSAQEDFHRLKPKAVVSLLSKDTPHLSFQGLPSERHLKLTFEDVNNGPNGPTPERISALISFGRSLSVLNDSDKVLVHCFAGISRSSAAILILAADRYGRDKLPAVVDALWAQSNELFPNRKMLELADKILKFPGSLTRAGLVLRSRSEDLLGSGLAAM